MNALSRGHRDSLEHRPSERGATITVETPLPDLVSDRRRDRADLLQPGRECGEISRARPPRRIVVRGTPRATGSIYEVDDNGRGIDPEDHQRIFDLFRRSGAQDQAGEGIGLAHVRALAYRLGGIITVDSTLGEGATFSSNLPVTSQTEGRPSMNEHRRQHRHDRG